jgi:superfamily II DNA/RNA helicase
VDTVASSMKKHGFKASPLHGDLDQRVRMATLANFKSGEIDFLVASDVAARGLDIPAVSHVFNFDVPTHAEDYVHRIGRTGRAGREGTAITIATNSEKKYVDAIEDLASKKLPVMELEGFELPQGSDDRPRGKGRSDKRSDSGKKRPPRGRSGNKNADRSSSDSHTDKKDEPAKAKSSEERKKRPSRRKGASPKTAQSSNNENKAAKPRGDQSSAMGDHMPAFLMNTSKPKK